MATVFKAYQPNLGRHVALKVLRHLPAQQPGFADRFQREAHIIASLSHPHILPVYDFGQDGDYSFLAMRYIEGAHTLKPVMTEPLALERAAGFILQLAQALDAAHQTGIIHRDVKPSNVLLDDDWVLLADFGLARMMEDAVQLTGTGVGIGTPAYMSPEQGQGLPVDHRTDIYALGIILFEMLTGQLPHNAETPFGIVLKRLTEPLPLPRSINPGIPEAVERVLLKALAREPEGRFQSAGALAEALRAALDELTAPTTLPAPTIPPPMAPRIMVHPPATGQDQRNRTILLQRVKEFWVKGVLERSPHGAALVELGLETRPQAVDHPWDMVLRTSDLPRLPIPPGTRAVDIFREMQQSLLILGEPGSGKTTMLLELARDLIARAEQDPAQPIPVVFNLASWAQSQPTLEAWLVAELNVRYSIPKRIAGDWVKNDSLLLLLDGLDEVVPARQEACVKALNAFRSEHLVPMVVSSRTADYEMLTARLKLQQAVVLQALSDQQVEAYLARAGPELTGLQANLQRESTLRELARSPLMLSMMTLAYRGLPAEALTSPSTTTDRLRHLFDTYLQQMFARRGSRQPYAPDQTRHWLFVLASGMLKDNQTLFMMEQLQPNWLPSRQLRLVYTLVIRLALLLVVFAPFVVPFLLAMGGLLLSWIVIDPSQFLRDYRVLAGSLVVAIFFAHGVWVAWQGERLTKSSIDQIKTVEFVSWSWRQGVERTKENMKEVLDKWRRMSLSERRLRSLALFIFLVVGYPIGAYGLAIYWRNELGTFLPPIVWMTLPLGGVVITLLSIFIANGFRSITSKTSVNQGIQLSWRNAIAGGIFAFLFSFFLGLAGLWILMAWLATNLQQTQPNWVTPGNTLVVIGIVAFSLLFSSFFSIIAALQAGGYAVVKHYVLRFLLWRNGQLPWNLARFLDYATERVFLQKVGGGYIFIHRYLLEYFAGLSATTDD